MAHVIKAAQQIVPSEDIHVIIGHQAESVCAAVGPMGVKFVLQAEQRGTGHAIMCAREQVAGYQNILVLSGDVPLIRPETIAQLTGLSSGQESGYDNSYRRTTRPIRLRARGPRQFEQ